MKKFCVLIILWLVCSSAYAESYVSDYLIIEEGETWDEFIVLSGLPQGTQASIFIEGQVYYFNKVLLKDQGLIAYGEFSDVARNDFKPVVGGYYSENSRLGEYRYHAYTAEGGKLGNDDFPRDASSARPLEDKTWIYKPWERESIAYETYQKHSSQLGFLNNKIFIRDAYNNTDPVSLLAKAQLNEALPYIKKGTYDGVTPASNLDAVYYANVQSRPTMKLSGQSIMFHKSILDGRIWYQTFPLLRSEDNLMKEGLPLEASIEEYHVAGITSTGLMTVFVKVVGHLQDESFYGLDEVEQYIYYDRDDIQSWEFDLQSLDLAVTYEPVASYSRFNNGNMAYQWFKVDMSHSDYRDLNSTDYVFEHQVKGLVTVNFPNEHSEVAEVIDKLLLDNADMTFDEFHGDQADFEVTAPYEILDVWSFNLSLVEIEVGDSYERSVTINGSLLSETQETEFISGNYVFEDLDRSKLYDYEIKYSDGENDYFYKSWVLVYDAVPSASVKVVDYGKVNRKNSIEVDDSITPEFVKEHSSVELLDFTIMSRDGQTIYYDVNNQALKEYMIKEIGSVDICVEIGNEYGLRTYLYEIYSGEDYPPDLISIIWNNSLVRGDEIDVFSEASSLDDDTVSAIFYEVFFDHDEDGIADHLLYPKSEYLGKIDFQPLELGYYEIEFSVEEDFGQPTIIDSIREEDYQSQVVRREFMVENLRPMTKVFTDIPYEFPQVEVTFLIDEDFPSADLAYLRENNVNIRNDFRLSSIDCVIDVWDLKTYEYSQTAHISRHTGSYPPITYTYSSLGYSGILSRYKIRNYPYTVDKGSYVTTTESKTIKTTRYQSGTVYWPDKYDSNRTPTSISYSSAGFTGTMYRDYQGNWSASNFYNDDGSYGGYTYSFTQYYKGTASKVSSVWVPNLVTYNDYYGDYSGSVNKYVKQVYYPDPTKESNKFLVYFTKDTINNLEDLEALKSIIPEANIILVSDESLFKSINENDSISYIDETDKIINQMIQVVKEENPFTSIKTILVGQTFQLETNDRDEEGDPIVEEGFQVIHHPDVFENPMAQEENTFLSYKATQFSPGEISSFQNAGSYQIYRQIKDQPISHPDQGMYSNLSTLELLVHRKPIASDRMDWTYNAISGLYEIDWVDTSYDPDFQYSANRGILDRKMRYKKTGQPWIYGIPKLLEAGEYTRELIVKDIYGQWSDTYLEVFTLSALPPPQILTGQLHSKDDTFTLESIPHTEILSLRDFKVRFPYALDFKYEWIREGLVIESDNFFPEGNDGGIDYHPIDFTIPKSLTDGGYIFKVYAIDQNNIDNYDVLSFSVCVKTPFDLEASIPELVAGENKISVNTSKYVDEVLLTLYVDTIYEKTVSMTQESTSWSYLEVLPELDPMNYTFKFEGLIKSEPYQIAYLLLDSEYLGLSLSSILIEGMWNYYNGEDNIFYKPKENNPHRFLSLEEISIRVIASGEPESIEITMSDELMSLNYSDDYGNVYSYDTLLGYTVDFPLLMETTDHINYSMKYVLPLADSTISRDNTRLRQSYFMELKLIKGSKSLSYYVTDIEISGNTLDCIYLEPIY